MLLLKRAYQVFFFIGLFLIPFNSDIPDWLGFLGELSADSSPIFFLIGFLFLFCYQCIIGKLYFPVQSKTYRLFLLFLVAIIITTLINLPSIVEYYYKQTSGIYRFIRQFISVLISGVIFLYLFINVGRDYGIERFVLAVRKTFLYSFYIVFSYGMLEYAIIKLNLTFLTSILDLYGYLPFVEVKFTHYMERLSSITYEPPALGLYLITVSGFIFSYIFTSKKVTRFVPFALLMLLAILSKSRTALVVTILQAIAGVVFAFYKYKSFRNLFNKVLIFGSIALVVLLVFFGKPIYEAGLERIESLNFSKIDTKNNISAISNKSRIGIQLAMLEVFKEKPIFGTGWGQQFYESRHHYPTWATRNNFEFRLFYLNQDLKSFPPGYNLYFRILVETGIFGLFVFLFFLFSIVRTTLIVYKRGKELNFITLILLVNFTGLLLNWFQTDSMRIYGFWLSLAILILYKRHLDLKREDAEDDFSTQKEIE
ncbi:O-antigen ligase family protein [Cochleicola gelatinilyticus]|uniref:O-antigen ligase-related domain-containing protein n=1 Tax=Cochleicola gelatinilyticus TaxID=1763537 RepID=A0A167J1A6_9FLAO|nr:O-antigen ligase family protein [Cochleicola gelatinilyticus]OAB80225.1 hypothetical protein ULVI_05680 [Cochleicola gelatinilyticus]